jgi:phosphatidylglycerophosphate synthase
MEARRYKGIYAIKPWWQGRLTTVEDMLIRYRVHPDVITLAGVVCSGLLGIALWGSGQRPWLALVVIPLAIGRLAANALDGLVARKTGLARPLGEFLNECCDRVADILVFAGLALTSQVVAPLAWGVLVLALFSSFAGVTSKAVGGKRQFGGLLAKADRMIWLAAFSPVVVWRGAVAWNWFLLAALPALLITLVQRSYWTYRDLKQAEYKEEAR